ncbi:MAG: hypothetical protein ACRDHP_06335, partial [Ktedonobacterales bacterium]
FGAARGEAADETPEVPSTARSRRRGTAPPWRRVALQSAAVLALLVGSALLIKQGLLYSGGTTGHSQQTIGGHGGVVPLAAGPRAVYLRGGALWSMPENGPGLAQQLTPAGVRVAGWAVSPNGRSVAYVNATDGSIHVIRSDDQNDHALPGTSGTLPAGFWSSTAGQAVAAGLSWSPDGKSLAYVAADGSGQTVLHIVSADGKANAAWGSAAAWTGPAIWSADGNQLAFAQSDSAGGQTLSVYDATTHQAFQLGAAGSVNANATVAHIAWLTGTPYPILTWAAATNGTVTGIYTQQAAPGTSATPVGPAGMTYSAADFSAANGSDMWLVATGHTLATLPVGTSRGAGATTPVGDTVTQIVWSPSGATAAYVTADGHLGLWTPSLSGTPMTVASQIVGIPIWSPDSSRLAVQAGNDVISVRIASGNTTRYATVSGAVELAWSPDSQALAIGSSSGVRVAINGSISLPDAVAPAAGAIRWTIAG